MRNTPLILTIGLIVLLAGGYFVYSKFFNQKPLNTWDLIPEQTVLVYEVGNCADCLDKTMDTAPNVIYGSVLFPFNPQDSVYKLFEFLKKPVNGQLVSLHVTSKSDFDFVFYSPVSKLKDIQSFENLKQAKGIKYSEREFNGNKIQELKFEKYTFSWVILENLVVASFTPFLVEDVIRTYTSGEKSSFLNQVSEVYQLPRIKNDAGNIYVHLNNFVSWLNLFSENPFRGNLPFGQASLLDVKQDEKSLTLNGFSLARKNSAASLLSILEGQTPVQYSIKQFISERTLTSINYGVSDGSLLFKKLTIGKDKQTRDTLNSLVKLNIEELYSTLGPEMSLNYLEGKANSQSKVFLFQSHDVDQWLSYFNKLSNAVEREDTVFFEQYSSYEIREIEIHDLPGKLFSPLISGFDITYYSSIGNTIIIADDLENLKAFLQDIDHEEVWGKSVSFNRFLESTLLESSFSIYVNTPLVWNLLSKKLSTRWRDFIKNNDQTLRSLDLGAVQFSYLNESFYTNITWKYGTVKSKPGKNQPKLSKQIVTNFESSIIAGPYIIRNHASKQDEIIIQDSLYNVYQVSSDGKILWKNSLEGPIVGGIEQVDYFKNGKLQIFFATDKRIHIIDRLGNYVKPFPITIPTQQIEYSKLVDYDNSKKYRFLVTDATGKLWMYDKEGGNLDGWTPRVIDGTLISAARHYRIRGKDFIVAVKKDGWAYVFNRRGEILKGFPLNLDARPDGDFYLESGNTLQTSYFVCVSRDGFRVKFNLDGKIVTKETLIKPTIETKFSLISEQTGKSYLIKRQDVSKLTLLNENLKEIVLNEFVGVNPVDIQYNNFGSGKEFISITDKVQNLTYLYNGSGKLLNSIPLESKGISIRPESSSQSKVITVYDAALTIQMIDN